MEMFSYEPSSPNMVSRYHAKPVEVKEKIKEAARERYRKDPAKARRNIYYKMIRSGYIKTPSQRCLLQYNITWDEDAQAYVLH